MEAGDKLCERMRDVLHDPDSHKAVLTCFHRVMLLGFLGEYRTLDDPDRRALVKILSERVMSFSYRQMQAPQASLRSRENRDGWLTSWPTRIGLSVLLLGVAWLGFDYWFDRMLLTLLPFGAMK